MKMKLEQVKEFFSTHFDGEGQFAYLKAYDEARDLELFDVHFLLNGEDIAYFIGEESDLQKAQIHFLELAQKYWIKNAKWAATWVDI